MKTICLKFKHKNLFKNKLIKLNYKTSFFEKKYVTNF